MRIRSRLLLFHCFILLSVSAIQSQTFTMSNSCYKLNKQGKAALQVKDYDSALHVFKSMKGKCSSKDGKEALNTGIAESYNGLKQYDEALAASKEALKASKNKSVSGWFQKAVAENKLDKQEDAKNSLAKVISLTEKNKNTKERASNYVIMGALYERYFNNRDSALYFINKGIELDPSNASFYVEKGDYYARDKDYENAFKQYNKAASLGKNDLEVYQTRAMLRIRMMQEKYKTTNTQELRTKMSAEEKKAVCKDLKKAQQLGMKDVQLDLFAALICK